MITSLFPESKDPCGYCCCCVVVSGGVTPQKRKRSESQSASIPQTQSITEDPRVCPREHTMSKVAALLDDVSIVHVRGTPASGKTCLSHLLMYYYREKGRKSF